MSSGVGRSGNEVVFLCAVMVVHFRSPAEGPTRGQSTTELSFSHTDFLAHLERKLCEDQK